MSQKPQPGTQIKLLVNTASEAVNAIRERYGEMARVLSVKQVEASGLKRLVSKPRLEVIVEVLSSGKEEEAIAPKKEAKPRASDTAAPRSESQTTEPQEAAPQRSRNQIGNLYNKNQEKESEGASDYFSQFEESAPKESEVSEKKPLSEDASDAPLGSAANPVQRGTLEAVQRAISMLEAVGFDRSLIERIRSEVNFKDIGNLPTMELYAKICDWLRSRVPVTRNVSLKNRRAFVGCSGVGKTSALCKTLSSEVFLKGNTPTVLKVDAELPNPSDSLEVFCEIMGVSLARSAEEVTEISEDRPLLVDMPGFSLSDSASLENCRDTLDALGIDERILVVNAAYEAELIADMMAAGDAVGANRIVFTHLEETRKAGKLWKFLLNGRMSPLFFSEGPNPAGEYTMETYSHLLERSFPNGRELAAAIKRGKGTNNARVEEAAFKS